MEPLDPEKTIEEVELLEPGFREYPISPIGKPRMTQRDKWKGRDCVLRYLAFKDECRLHKVSVNLSDDHITFIVPMPASWSEKKKNNMDGMPHQLKPDADNMLKAVWDAVLPEDCKVWDCRITKRWGRVGKIIIKSS
jgi:hypothetical protein